MKSCSHFSRASFWAGFVGGNVEGPLGISSCFGVPSMRPTTEVEDTGMLSLGVFYFVFGSGTKWVTCFLCLQVILLYFIFESQIFFKY